MTNFSGLAHGTPEGAWGHFPPLPTTDLIPVGWNIGQNPVNTGTTSFIGKDRMLESPSWGVLSGSGGLTRDANGLPASWTSPSDTVLATAIYSPQGANGLANDKGFGNSIGVWTTYHVDSAYGTADQKSVVLSYDNTLTGSVAISLASPVGRGQPRHPEMERRLHVGKSDGLVPLPQDPRVGAVEHGRHVRLDDLESVQPLGPRQPLCGRAPAQDGAAAATPDFTKPYAIDDNVLAAWVTGNGVAPFSLRAMESFGGAGPDNRIYQCDLVDVNKNWQSYSTYSATAGYVRFLNTDPSSATYSWSSTRVYGPQAPFVMADTTTYTLGVTLTAGSNVAALTSGTPQLCGSSVTAISGTGAIPAGTLLAYFTGSEVVFDAPATASGAATLTLQHPGYIPLPPTDNGQYVNGGYGFG